MCSSTLIFWIIRSSSTWPLFFQVIIPLLGITYIITIVGPTPEQQGYLIFQYLRAVLLSTQVSSSHVVSQLTPLLVMFLFNCPLPPFPSTWSWLTCSLNNSKRLSYLTWWLSLHRPRWMGNELPSNPLVAMRLPLKYLRSPLQDLSNLNLNVMICLGNWTTVTCKNYIDWCQ